MVEFGQAPIDQTQLSLLVVNHHVVWLHIPVHDAHGVAIVERFQQFVQIISDLIVGKCLI